MQRIKDRGWIKDRAYTVGEITSSTVNSQRPNTRNLSNERTALQISSRIPSISVVLSTSNQFSQNPFAYGLLTRRHQVEDLVEHCFHSNDHNALTRILSHRVLFISKRIDMPPRAISSLCSDGLISLLHQAIQESADGPFPWPGM